MEGWGTSQGSGGISDIDVPLRLSLRWTPFVAVGVVGVLDLRHRLLRKIRSEVVYI